MIKVPVRTVRVKVLHKNQQLGSSSLAALALSHKPMKACIFHDFICQVKQVNQLRWCFPVFVSSNAMKHIVDATASTAECQTFIVQFGSTWCITFNKLQGSSYFQIFPECTTSEGVGRSALNCSETSVALLKAYRILVRVPCMEIKRSFDAQQAICPEPGQQISLPEIQM